MFWRSFSIEALLGSKHLEYLLEKNLITVSPSATLDRLYINKGHASTPVAKTSQPRKASEDDQTHDHALSEEVMLLSSHDGKVVAGGLEVPELALEIERAVHQVEGALRAEAELKRDKQSLDAATSSPGAESDLSKAHHGDRQKH